MTEQNPPEPNLETAGSVSADSLIQVIRKAAVLIALCWRKLSKRMFFSDFFSVAASIGFVIVPAFLVGLIFLILPQGRDALLIIVEQLMSGNGWSLFGLLAAVLIWSMFSELAVRYAISISDNSGLNLSDIRVLWRKTIQKLLAGLFLLWPCLLVLTGLIITLFSAEYLLWKERLLFIGIPILLVAMLIWVLSFFYFHKFEPKRKGGSKQTLFGHRALPGMEQTWLNKLYGIYNDYIFNLPKPTNFKGIYREELADFTSLYLGAGASADPDLFPQDTKALDRRRVVPETFELLNAGKIKNSTGIYKWVYCVPPLKVYPVFHGQVRKIALLGLGILIAVSLIPAEWPFFDHIGAPGLVCLAFACYTGIYAGILYLEKVVFPRFPVSIRLLLLIWIITISFVNQDHPVRLYGQQTNRPALQEHFSRWFSEYKNQMDIRLGHPLKKYPVVFVCAEGGAFRTGAYTALFLTKMEAELQKRKQSVDFRHSIYAMSGVSGGAVGLGFYNAAAFRSAIPFRDTITVKKTRRFFLHDSLSPLIGKMFFSEFLNLFYWHKLDLFDRSAALEKSWETAYSEFVDKGTGNIYQDPFNLPDTGYAKPALIINTEEVETGIQCWISTVRPDSLLFAPQRDLYKYKIGNTRYSTGINFSSRFPLFSPGAEIKTKTGRLHYLDGGYVENTGTGTMLEILSELRKTEAYKQVIPVIISLRFSETGKDTTGVRFLNEITEITNGLYNTRSGRSESASALLKMNIRPDSGVFISAPLSPKEKQIPMNWVLSEQSMDRIQEDIRRKFHPDSPVLQKFFRKGLTYLPLKPVPH